MSAVEEDRKDAWYDPKIKKLSNYEAEQLVLAQILKMSYRDYGAQVSLETALPFGDLGNLLMEPGWAPAFTDVSVFCFPSTRKFGPFEVSVTGHVKHF